MYPDHVAGMVFVDPTTDNQRFDDAAGVPALASWRDTLDQSRANRVPSGMPVFLIDAISPLDVPFATEAVRRLRMNNRPEIEADSLECRRWLAGIPGSRLIVTNRSGHNVPLEQPELVVATIREAIEAAARRQHR